MKMTNEAAKMLLQIGIEKHLHNGTYDEAIKMGIEALDKQIPKKPVLIEDKMWTCPSCDNNLHWKYSKYPTELNGKGFPYCLSCGQAIDWSEKK